MAAHSASTAATALELVAMEASKPERVVAASRVLEGRAYRLRCPGSIAVSLCYVASGRFDGMLSTRPCRSVDAAAAQLVLSEAGGVLAFGGGALADTPLDLDARFHVAGARTDRRPRDPARGPAGGGLMGVVDWQLAERIALALAGEGPRWDGDEQELRAESDASRAARSPLHGPKARGGLPEAELVDRAEWARVNLDSFRGMSGRRRGEALRADAATPASRAASRRSSPAPRPGPRSGSRSATSPSA